MMKKRLSPAARLMGLLLLMLIAIQACSVKDASKAPFAGTEVVLSFGKAPEIQAFIESMVEVHGFNKKVLRETFSQIQYSEASIVPFRPRPSDSDQAKAGKQKDWREYRARFVTPYWVDAGVDFWDQYADDLARAEVEYGVDADIIVGIIGVETRYGRHTGKHRVLDTLATLAFDYPEVPNRAVRMDFFRNQLEHALLYARESGIDPLSLSGSYAGAIGWPQFMPGSIRRFAVDFDGDGKIDLIHSPKDAIGSIASYLASHGWLRGEPIVSPAQLDSVSPQMLDELLSNGLKADYCLYELQAFGITAAGTQPKDTRFGVVDLQNGFEPTEYWLATNNFFAITQYNRSYFYAMAVVDLGQSVRSRRDAERH